MTPIQRVSIKSQALAVLGLNNTTATASDIRLAYRARVREKHPDRCDGDASAFLQITDAFKFLCGDTEEFDPNLPEQTQSEEESEQTFSRTPRPSMDFTLKPRTRSKTLSRPVSKPMVQETETAIAKSVLRSCQDMLGDAHGHCATHQKRAGRRLSYTVPVKLLNNVNNVVVPTGDLFDTRKTLPIMLTINACDISGGSYVVPSDVVEAQFPGARHVEICFTADI